jgi:hypothetical protein
MRGGGGDQTGLMVDWGVWQWVYEFGMLDGRTSTIWLTEGGVRAHEYGGGG